MKEKTIKTLTSEKFIIDIFEVDVSHYEHTEQDIFYGYYIKNIITSEIILEGDGFTSEDELILYLSDLSEALRSIFG